MNSSHAKETQVNKILERICPMAMRNFFDLLKWANQKTHINSQNTYF